MSVQRIVMAMMAGCATVVISAVPVFAAQMSHEDHATAAQMKPSSGMAAKCQAMMAEREKMMADMKAADQRLDGLVATMNATSGMEKMTATSAVVTEMVTQHRTMQGGTMKTPQDMMGHMMAHMQAGKDSMASCPMMKQMGDMKH